MLNLQTKLFELQDKLRQQKLIIQQLETKHFAKRTNEEIKR